MKVTVSTTAYQWAHGKKPSGRGYWAFEFENVEGKKSVEFTPGHTMSCGSFWVAGATTYGEGKKWAIGRAAELGSVKVAVAT